MTSLLEDIDASITEVNNALKDSTTHLPIIACGSALHYLKQLRQKVVELIDQANNIRLADVNCDPNDMRDKILEMLGEKITK